MNTSNNMYVERRKRVVERLKSNGISQMIIWDPASILYLTGEKVYAFERMWALYLADGREPVLFANKLFVLSGNTDVKVVWHTDVDDGAAQLAEYTNHEDVLGIDKVMPAKYLLALQEYGAATGYKNTSCYVDAVRGEKDEQERKLMIEASRINDLAMDRFKALIHDGVTEQEVAAQIEGIYKELGAQGNSFTPIVCFGANAANPHHEPDDTVITEGDVVLFDVGCIKDDYCSDMTRTFFYKTASDKQREVYEIVKNANLAGEAAMGPGKRFCDADSAARDLITEKGYGEYFTHRLGHSVGMEVHESGDVSSANTDKFTPGRCISCEPGIYLPEEFGVRIEDLCLITEDGVTVMNNYSKELEIIG